jgi:hypothetical protein
VDAATRERQILKIAEWISTICQPDQIIEVRALHPFGSRVFSLVEGAVPVATFAANASGISKGVYFTPNPLSHLNCGGSQGTAVDGDIAGRDWLLVDCDPARPPDTNSTDAEHEAALKVARDVRNALVALGFGGIILSDSGNGAHLMIPWAAPADDTGRAKHKQFLEVLNERFGTSVVQIDKKTFNAARIWKLPGTLSNKGPHTTERPRRYARVLESVESPHRFATGNAAALEKFLPSATPEQPVCDTSILSGFDRDFTPRKLSRDEPSPRAALIHRAAAYISKEPPAISGQGGHDRCFHVACILRVDFTLSVDEAFEVIQEWNARCQPPWSEKEIRHKLEDADKQQGPRGRLAGQQTITGRAAAPAAWPATERPELPERLTIRASEITPVKVQWLWPNRIPLGKLTTFAGGSGVGKTFTLIDIAARVSRGSEWPSSEGACAPEGKVLFISAEDEPDDTLVPRLIECGADLTNVSFLKSEVADYYTLADIPLLERALEEAGPDVKYVAVDPPTAFLGGVNDHKNAELRALLSPLKTLAAKHKVAIVFVTHVNKQGGQVDAIMRIIGSVAWVNAVRSAHMFAKDPEDPERRLMCPVKVNVGPEPKGIAYKLARNGDMARVEWLGLVDTTADEAINHRQTPRGVRASQWLIEKFREQLEWRSNELFSAAEAEGISRKAIFDARGQLELPRARKVTDQAGNTSWIWWVPADWIPLLGDPIP